MADIKFVDDRVQLEGPIVSSGEFAANGGLTCSTGEVRSFGPLAGYSFTARDGAFLAPDPGNRWVWYAAGQSARLWSGSDMVTIRWTNQPQQQVSMELTNGTLHCSNVKLDGLGDVADVIVGLMNRIHALEAKLGIATGPIIGQPVRIGDNQGTGRPPFIKK